ncbi:hypothetical protein Leryth_020146 [Lithospermum erythrorhizon]|nr:hypothetical protein Leryth_020146 [Lithospermum erythrorhizon]
MVVVIKADPCQDVTVDSNIATVQNFKIVDNEGKELGFVNSHKGNVKARGSSYVNARLELVGVEFFDDVVPLIADLAKGVVTFDTVTQIGGQLGLYLFEIPLKAKVACEIVIDVHNQTINHQNCYPE